MISSESALHWLKYTALEALINWKIPFSKLFSHVYLRDNYNANST